MNYYAPMNHHNHHMSHQTQLHFPQEPFPDFPTTNRFIFVNPNPVAIPKVLVNPHFKKKVYVNPQFKPPPSVLPKPKIHVNPNVLKNFVPTTEVKASAVAKTTTVISTRNKLVRIPCNSRESPRKRRTSLHTKYKIVRSAGNTSVSKFKIDKRTAKTVNSPNLRSIKKKYVYINRFLSINVVAKSVLLKKNANMSKPGFVNINGILYKKSPNSLKKATDTSVLKTSKYKLVRKTTRQLANTSMKNVSRRSLVKRYQLIRSRKQVVKVTPSKLKKCNIPCPIYRKFGKCAGKDKGTCIKLHNPDQIVLCTRFLQGACHNKNCLFSHKVSLEKMPTCKYYLDGLCSKDDCPYLHVKINPKADICRHFLEGFCKKGAQCDKRHQFLCPEFEKNKSCRKRRCPYPHGSVVRRSKVLNMVAKKCSKKATTRKKVVKTTDVILAEKDRYYKESEGAKNLSVRAELFHEAVVKFVSRNRPKLGELPAFIPFSEAI